MQTLYPYTHTSGAHGFPHTSRMSYSLLDCGSKVVFAISEVVPFNIAHVPIRMKTNGKKQAPTEDGFIGSLSPG